MTRGTLAAEFFRQFFLDFEILRSYRWSHTLRGVPEKGARREGKPESNARMKKADKKTSKKTGE